MDDPQPPPSDDDDLQPPSDDEVFVAEDGYTQLCDDDGDDAGHSSPPPELDDLEQAIDKRLHAEFAERQAQSPERTAPPPPACEAPTAARPIQIEASDQMPAEHVAQIRRIMAGIELSKDATPEWATRIPESAWMPQRKPSEQ